MVGIIFLAACGPAVPDGASGSEIYQISCSRCHGGDLEGTSLAPSLGSGSDLVDKDDAYATQTIARGRGSMPSFERGLTAEQIEDVLGYIRDQQ